MSRAMKLEDRAIETLLPYAQNARTHSEAQIAQIAASIQRFGWTNPILVDGAGRIAAGHGRVLAAQRLGLTKVPCLRVDFLSEDDLRAYVIADNQLALNAGWDKSILRAEVALLRDAGFSLELLGFSAVDLADLVGIGDDEADDAPALRPEAVCRLGDVWALGEHRLAVGDARDRELHRRLLVDGVADACWTDPPYNVAYETPAGKIDNDDLSGADFEAFLGEAFAALAASLRGGAPVYVAHADTEGLVFRTVFARSFKLSGCLVWAKDVPVLGRSDYQWAHEPILYGWKAGARHTWHGGRRQRTVAELGLVGDTLTELEDGRWALRLGGRTLLIPAGAKLQEIESTVLREPRPKRSAEHPTMKPVQLVERMLRNSCAKGARVLDPFAGSGTTLVACERLALVARVIELSPHYADVIVRRWQQLTGGSATCDGQSFNDREAALQGAVQELAPVDP
jgi:DNA modification methylase